MNKRLKVAVTDYGFPDLHQEEELLRPLGFEFATGQCRTPEEVAALCADADAILTQWAPVDATVIEALQHCRIIVRYGIGVDNVDLEAAAVRGIPVVNVPDYAVDEVADHAISLMLASVRKIPQVVADVRAGEWQIAPRRPIYGLRGRTIGTAGFGNIARAVIQRAQAFGMDAIAYDPYVKDDVFAERGVRRADWATLLADSDVLSLHLPLNAETRGAMSQEAFRSMKPTAYVVNTSRGGILDAEALAEALRDGRIAGAALDVLEREPIERDHPLLRLDQCLVTSHCAWYSEDSLLRLQQFAALEIKRLFTGERPRHIVNKVVV
ncbi:C-terminal binding protein [Paenibacillus sp. IB182496]|uniref:C-terminal binding protein n=1 Tax=Paenibacillus sabuli TaxID=2772509 RepID=A0A927BQ07_9BACL|nr:C-terminal binding protein [Paenibacillus sabuli]MBD2843565.1 C-terminal binding protein [Paenibacillus sabuli]